jgi:hypothetical protein
VHFRTWQDRLCKAETDLRRLRDRRTKTTDPYELYSLDEDIEFVTYQLEAARYMLREHDTRSAPPRRRQPFLSEIPYDPEVEGPIDLACLNTVTGGADDGNAEA